MLSDERSKDDGSDELLDSPRSTVESVKRKQNGKEKANKQRLQIFLDDGGN